MLAGALLGPPADALDCVRKEFHQSRKLEASLMRCDGEADCEANERQECTEHLLRFSCDTDVCMPRPPLGGTEDMCVFDRAGPFVAVADEALTGLQAVLNAGAWADFVHDEELDPWIDLLPATTSSMGKSACLETGGIVACGEVFPFTFECEDVTVEVSVPKLTGLAGMQFDEVRVTDVRTQNLSVFTNRGPYAGLVFDTPAPPAGINWQDEDWAITLPVADPRASIQVDLGVPTRLCATDAPPCVPMRFSGRGDASYRVEYSLDGRVWSTWADIPTSCTSSCSTLRTQLVVVPDEVEARFVRVYATGTLGDAKYSVAELTFTAVRGDGKEYRPARGKPARGPQPLVISSLHATDGSAWNDPRATVLPNNGPESALTIDLGLPVWTRTDSPGLSFGRSGNDHYTLEYSPDGIEWMPWVEYGPKSGGATSKLVTETIPAPTVRAQFIRVYPSPSQGSASDGKYSVSYVRFPFSLAQNGTLMHPDTLDSGLPATARGPESLMTDGHFADDGTPWDDPSVAMVLPIRNGVSTDAIVDLGKGAGRSIDRVVLQASGNDVYQVDISPDGENWTALWTADVVSPSKDHLETRDSEDTLRDPANPNIGRYVRVRPVDGDNKNSISEIAVYNNILERGCPFDPTANGPSNDSPCAYSGDASGVAKFEGCGDKCLHASLADIKLRALCVNALDSFHVELFPGNGETTTAECDIGTSSGSAGANFCSVSCLDDAQAAITYLAVDALSLETDSVSCTIGSFPAPLPAPDSVIKAVVKAVIPPIEAELNKVLDSEIPYPGAVCSQ